MVQFAALTPILKAGDAIVVADEMHKPVLALFIEILLL
jgi:hypothetical protein